MDWETLQIVVHLVIGAMWAGYVYQKDGLDVEKDAFVIVCCFFAWPIAMPFRIGRYFARK